MRKGQTKESKQASAQKEGRQRNAHSLSPSAVRQNLSPLPQKLTKLQDQELTKYLKYFVSIQQYKQINQGKQLLQLISSQSDEKKLQKACQMVCYFFAHAKAEGKVCGLQFIKEMMDINRSKIFLVIQKFTLKYLIEAIQYRNNVKSLTRGSSFFLKQIDKNLSEKEMSQLIRMSNTYCRMSHQMIFIWGSRYYPLSNFGIVYKKLKKYCTFPNYPDQFKFFKQSKVQQLSQSKKCQQINQWIKTKKKIDVPPLSGRSNKSKGNTNKGKQQQSQRHDQNLSEQDEIKNRNSKNQQKIISNIKKYHKNQQKQLVVEVQDQQEDVFSRESTKYQSKIVSPRPPKLPGSKSQKIISKPPTKLQQQQKIPRNIIFRQSSVEDPHNALNEIQNQESVQYLKTKDGYIDIPLGIIPERKTEEGSSKNRIQSKPQSKNSFQSSLDEWQLRISQIQENMRKKSKQLEAQKQNSQLNNKQNKQTIQRQVIQPQDLQKNKQKLEKLQQKSTKILSFGQVKQISAPQKENLDLSNDNNSGEKIQNSKRLADWKKQENDSIESQRMGILIQSVPQTENQDSDFQSQVEKYQGIEIIQNKKIQQQIKIDRLGPSSIKNKIQSNNATINIQIQQKSINKKQNGSKSQTKEQGHAKNQFKNDQIQNKHKSLPHQKNQEKIICNQQKNNQIKYSKSIQDKPDSQNGKGINKITKRQQQQIKYRNIISIKSGTQSKNQQKKVFKDQIQIQQKEKKSQNKSINKQGQIKKQRLNQKKQLQIKKLIQQNSNKVNQKFDKNLKISKNTIYSNQDEPQYINTQQNQTENDIRASDESQTISRSSQNYKHKRSNSQNFKRRNKKLFSQTNEYQDEYKNETKIELQQVNIHKESNNKKQQTLKSRQRQTQVKKERQNQNQQQKQKPKKSQNYIQKQGQKLQQQKKPKQLLQDNPKQVKNQRLNENKNINNGKFIQSQRQPKQKMKDTSMRSTKIIKQKQSQVKQTQKNAFKRKLSYNKVYEIKQLSTKKPETIEDLALKQKNKKQQYQMQRKIQNKRKLKKFRQVALTLIPEKQTNENDSTLGRRTNFQGQSLQIQSKIKHQVLQKLLQTQKSQMNQLKQTLFSQIKNLEQNNIQKNKTFFKQIKQIIEQKQQNKTSLFKNSIDRNFKNFGKTHSNLQVKSLSIQTKNGGFFNQQSEQLEKRLGNFNQTSSHAFSKKQRRISSKKSSLSQIKNKKQYLYQEGTMLYFMSKKKSVII